jgi:uncharacterized protein YbjQ (UPF0145 family)
MILTTTDSVFGFKADDYFGVVFAETIVSANAFRDMLAGLINFFGGRVRGYEKEMRAARKDVLQKLVAQAEQVGANAILGIRVDYEFLQVGSRGGLLMVAAQGTAVKLVAKQAEGNYGEVYSIPQAS